MCVCTHTPGCLYVQVPMNTGAPIGQRHVISLKLELRWLWIAWCVRNLGPLVAICNFYGFRLFGVCFALLAILGKKWPTTESKCRLGSHGFYLLWEIEVTWQPLDHCFWNRKKYIWHCLEVPFPLDKRKSVAAEMDSLSMSGNNQVQWEFCLLWIFLGRFSL